MYAFIFRYFSDEDDDVLPDDLIVAAFVLAAAVHIWFLLM